MPNRPIRTIIQNQRVHTVPTNASVRTAAHIMKENKISSVMVVDGDRLAGIFTERDALFRVLAGGLDPDRTTMAQVMTSDPITTTADRPLVHALHLMQEGGFRHIPVVDRGRPAGMVSMRDAMGIELARFERELSEKQAIAEILA
ncbi:CBS domain-containing protein [Azospirillum sp. RWY-5-1]|uniref:CBS domain-containing protein n=1 Tax=Azospirillum oleiclasticum TaxID=2735135 RepID=A0ABX2T2H8_9PROT|nr:CBS domain-containing protein [Azospirillum oleiclasticum]NYZ11349.1 CBS domain-containing protein [Azospirillum oleiclasticum]NYZ18510.1 CBS domain-containing protein [Azospirillum oleiclasticum]